MQMRLFIGLVLWCILAVLCLPLAILVVVLFPIFWLLALPFRVAGIVVDAVLATLRAVLMLPARVLALPYRQRG